MFVNQIIIIFIFFCPNVESWNNTGLWHSSQKHIPSSGIKWLTLWGKKSQCHLLVNKLSCSSGTRWQQSSAIIKVPRFMNCDLPSFRCFLWQDDGEEWPKASLTFSHQRGEQTMITVSKSTLASKFLETVHSQLTLRSGDTVTNDRIERCCYC